MNRVLLWLLLAAVIVAALLARRFVPGGAGIDSSVAAADSFIAHTPDHHALRDSLDAERRRSGSLGVLLRLRSQPARAAAGARARVAVIEAVQAEAAGTDSARAAHWEAAYMARTEEADSLRRVIADQDEAAIHDSLETAAAVKALVLERARLDSANTIIIDLRVAVEQLRPSVLDNFGVGCVAAPPGRVACGVSAQVSARSIGRAIRKAMPW